MTGGASVLLKLLAAAFDQLAEAAPVVVGLSGAALELDLSWQRIDVDDADQLVSTVHEQLASTPVLAFPPWGRRTTRPDDRVRREVTSPSVLAEAVLGDFRPAGPASVLGVFLPASSLTSEQMRQAREAMAGIWHPAVVLYASDIIPGLSTGFSSASLILVPRHRATVSTLMFRIPNGAKIARIEKDFRRLLTSGTGRGEYGYVFQSSLPPGESLQFERYDPAILEHRADLTGYGSTTTLETVFELPAPGIHLARDRSLFCDADAENAVRVLTGRDIGRDGFLQPPDDHVRWATVPPSRQLEAGDMIVARIFRPSASGGLSVAEITAADLPAAASDSTITLRPRGQTSPGQRLSAMLYLRSPLAKTFALALATGLGGSAQLSRASLSDLPMPQPDRALATALIHVRDAQQRLEQWRDDADAVLQSAFLGDGATSARARVISAGRKLRLRVEAASQVDDFGQSVRMRFPHPIAFRWSRVQAALAADDLGHAYQEILDAAEILLCYEALLVLAFCHEIDLSLGAVNGIRQRLSAGRGPTFGDWTAVLQEAGTNRLIRGLPPAHPLQDLRSLAASTAATEAFGRIKNRRHDEAHQRRVDLVDMPAAVSDVMPDFTTLIQQAQVLADWPLALVDASRWDTFRRTATVTYRPMMGDHSVVPPRKVEYPSSDLEPGSLYVIDSDDQWHLLRPFLLGADCHVCKSWSTFHFDINRGELAIKSLEHGHVNEDQRLTESLKHVGML